MEDNKLTELRELLAEMREDIEDSSWMEEYPIIDEDGFADDCGCHVVRRADVYDWIDRLSAVLDPAAPPTK